MHWPLSVIVDCYLFEFRVMRGLRFNRSIKYNVPGGGGTVPFRPFIIGRYFCELS